MLKTVSSVANSLGALNYQGTWNATTNTPTLASGVGTQGDYYVVSVAGATDLDGITNWGVGDWAAYNGSVWQRVEGGADGNFVNLTVSGTSTLTGEIIANGGIALADNDKVTFGTSDDLVVYHDGNNSYIQDVGTGDLRIGGASVIIETAGGTKYVEGGSNVLRLYHTGSEKLRTSSSGIFVTGDVTIGTAGNGIDFSATGGTGTSELLDDYEEGDWTPAYTPTTGTFTTITTVVTGRYTKVGRLVTVFGSIRTSGTLDVTGASGNLKITGLPFACNATIAGGGADTVHQAWNLGTDILNTRMSVAAGASEILMYLNTMNGSSFPSGNITVADMSTSGGSFSNLISFTASYEV
jgi:hypothetical protein